MKEIGQMSEETKEKKTKKRLSDQWWIDRRNSDSPTYTKELKIYLFIWNLLSNSLSQGLSKLFCIATLSKYFQISATRER